MVGSSIWNVKLFLGLLTLVTVPMHGTPKPVVDPGLFMILGVETCRNGSGYCLLGLDCTLDDDFLPDDTGGHCNGLKKAFTPSAHFTCCKENPNPPVTQPPRRKKPIPILPDITTEEAVETVEVGNETTTTELMKYDDLSLTTANNEEATTDINKDINVNTDILTYTDPNIFIDVSNQVFKEVTAPVLLETTAMTNNL